jgi:hypothetical protein
MRQCDRSCYAKAKLKHVLSSSSHACEALFIDACCTGNVLRIALRSPSLTGSELTEVPATKVPAFANDTLFILVVMNAL